MSPDLTSPSPDLAVADDNGQYGSFVDPTEFAGSVATLPPEAFRQPPNPILLPTRTILTNLPDVTMQGTPAHLGSPGSCEAQSFGHGLGSYTAARNFDGTTRWDPSLPANALSAAWLYAWDHNLQATTCPGGTKALTYLNRLVAYGAPSEADVPYQADCTYLSAIDLNATYADSNQFIIGSYTTFSITSANLSLMKELLVAGRAIAFSGLVLKHYSTPTMSDAGVDLDTTPIVGSGHGQLVVGYDDTLGAFLVQNSFGTAWPGGAGLKGQIWWPYTTFVATQKLAVTAYPRDPAAATIPLTASSGSAPAGGFARVFQWAPSNGSGVYLILQHRFTTAVMLKSVAVTEPAGSTITGAYGQRINTGYSFFERTDGNQFLSGTYNVDLTAITLAGTTVHYTGTVTVPVAQPAAPPASAAAGPITDSTGAMATITP